MLTRDEVLKRRKGKVTVVPVPEWDGEVYLCQPSAADAIALAALSEKDTAEAKTAMMQIALRLVLDANHDRIFDGVANPEQDVPISVVNRLMASIGEAVAMTNATIEARVKN